MKPFIITTLFLLLITNRLKAQESLLGKSLSYIAESMRLTHYKLDLTGESKDGIKKYISYYSKPQRLTFYFNKNEENCNSIIEFEPKNFQSTIISNLNKSFLKINNSVWVSIDNTFVVKVDTEKQPQIIILTYNFLADAK